MARRSTPTQAPAAEPATTRERILDIALDLFIRKGYAETSLREIAAELGFSKAALYYHFESKQDILLALHMRGHHLTDDVLAMQNRRLIELHIRNQEAVAEIHRDLAPGGHAPVSRDIDQHVLGLLRDPSVPLESRVRRTASLGAIAAVLLAASAFADVPDAELEPALRTVVHDVIGRAGPM